MEFDYSKLRGRIVEKYATQEAFAREVGQTPTTISYKLKNRKPITRKDIIEWGKVFVLDTDNGAVIKSVRKTENDNEVECVSLNPAYQPFRIDTQYINGWYRVLMVLSLK